MKKHAVPLVVAAFVVAWAAEPALAFNRDLQHIQEQLDNLQQSVQTLQKTVDTQGAVLKTLIEQASDNVNTMKVAIAEMQKAEGQSLASTNNRFDSMSSQIQALSENLEETKARLAKLSDQLAQTQNIIQTLNTPSQAPQPAAGTTAAAPGPGGPTPVTKPTVPDADTLYQSGLSAYNGGQYELAMQAFQEYLQYYSDTDRASNAQFYIGECYYAQENYAQAMEEYDKCIERYPDGNKVAAAMLKKGYAYLALGQSASGAKELRALIERYPNAPESNLARQRLRKLTTTERHRSRD